MKFVIEIEPPVMATDEEILDWIKFNTGRTNELNLDNPLSQYELEAKGLSTLLAT